MMLRGGGSFRACAVINWVWVESLSKGLFTEKENVYGTMETDFGVGAGSDI